MPFTLANVEGRAALVTGDSYYDLKTLSQGALDADPMAALGALEQLSELSAQLSEQPPTGSLCDVMLVPPVPRPAKVFGIGLNYRNHALESGMELPRVPLVFTKYPSCIAGPYDDVVMRSDYVDFEAELVVVIGAGGKDISVDQAWSHVAGLCAGQDISDRPTQFSANPPQFNLGKSFDGFGPIGPLLVSPDSFSDASSLKIECRVNDEVRQSDRTNDLIFDVPTLVSHLSEICTLQTGDVIFTGTPGGVGIVEGRFLKNGDVIRTTIEGIGTLVNKCVRGSDHANANFLPANMHKRMAAAKEAANRNA